MFTRANSLPIIQPTYKIDFNANGTKKLSGSLPYVNYAVSLRTLKHALINYCKFPPPWHEQNHVILITI